MQLMAMACTSLLPPFLDCTLQRPGSGIPSGPSGLPGTPGMAVYYPNGPPVPSGQNPPAAVPGYALYQGGLYSPSGFGIRKCLKIARGVLYWKELKLLVVSPLFMIPESADYITNVASLLLLLGPKFQLRFDLLY